jgi:hypothetical protein
MNSEFGLSIIMKTNKFKAREKKRGERELSIGAEYVQVVGHFNH